MDAVEYLTKLNRMCTKSNSICSGTGCRECRSNYWNQEVQDNG